MTDDDREDMPADDSQVNHTQEEARALYLRERSALLAALSSFAIDPAWPEVADLISDPREVRRFTAKCHYADEKTNWSHYIGAAFVTSHALMFASPWALRRRYEWIDIDVLQAHPPYGSLSIVTTQGLRAEIGLDAYDPREIERVGALIFQHWNEARATRSTNQPVDPPPDA